MSYEFIDVSKEGGVTTITMNRSDKLNALHKPMQLELTAAFDDFAADDTQHVGVLTGSGERAFCAGSDIVSALASEHIDGSDDYYYGGICGRFDLHKPVIAAVNGLAMGGGFEVAISCDLIIAEEHATFGLSEARVGALPWGSGLHCLPRQIGLKAAMGILLTGRRFSAQEALSMGVINEVAAKGTLQDVVKRWCDEILACSPFAVRATKEVVMRSLNNASFYQDMENYKHSAIYQAWLNAEDTREGMSAFAEKRKPRWTGR